ncbi:calpain-B-like isoform X2 [Physella acuta]|uniref:calpain-B-like isoform X2 n=1 Tax=Physella acuta TaxID=109671 RepID=UPI0027DD547D|nr:calpain-B-like isoform X2 [Physella acuta]
MSNYYKTRTVRTYVSDGTGPPKVQTKTYTVGGPGGTSIGYAPSSDFGDFGNFGSRGFGDFGGQFNVDFGDNFGGKSLQFDVGGNRGGSRPSGGGSQYYVINDGRADPGQYSSTGRRAGPIIDPDPQPKLAGRPTRVLKKNPFVGLKFQNADEIRAQCRQQGILFEDPEFPCVDSSIFFSRSPPRPFEWKRPHEICGNPEWISAGASRFDVKQGELGDCWLLAAVASLTCNQKLFDHVVEPNQSFTSDYCGLFKFNFWHQGDWQEVVVDDRLPTYKNQLVFMHSTEKNEFWSALLEKAYAKLMGSYESLKGGSTSEAMEDFTGGVTEMFDLPKAPANLLQIMLKAHERGSLMGCSIDADPGKIEAELANGLIMGHAYSITSVQLADIQTPRMKGQIPMVRIRNPWGNGSEWKGAWSDGSREWSLLSEDEKKELGLNFDDDGEFWMSFQDFITNFQKLEICNLGPDSLDEDDLSNKKKWECFKEHGNWIRRVNAGGCRNYLETFWTNPQFRMTLTDVDENDGDDLCTAIVAVLQKDRRKKRKEGLDLLTIGYVIYKLEDPNCGPLDMKFFKYNASVAKSPTFINMREICGRHKLPPGTYAIVPSTFEPHYEGEFLMRIFTEKANISGEIDEQTRLDEDTAKNGPGKGKERPAPNEQEKAQADALKQSFRRIAGEDMEIDAYELQDILNTVFTKEFKFPGFGIDTCRSMVAMHDGDLSGKLGYDEFKELWEDLRRWKGVFKEFDKDNSGNLSSYELRSALNHVGFHVSNRTFKSLVMRYSNKNGQVDFGDFIMCSIRLKTMLTSFKGHDPNNTGLAPYDIDSFIQTTMYS